jgi:hypothetical protein
MAIFNMRGHLIGHGFKVFLLKQINGIMLLLFMMVQHKRFIKMEKKNLKELKQELLHRMAMV